MKPFPLFLAPLTHTTELEAGATVNIFPTQDKVPKHFNKYLFQMGLSNISTRFLNPNTVRHNVLAGLVLADMFIRLVQVFKKIVFKATTKLLCRLKMSISIVNTCDSQDWSPK